MTKFQSKELNRVFETVLFLGKVSTDPNNLNEPAPAMVKDTNTGMGQAGEMASSTGGGTADAEYKRSITPVEKKEVKIAPASGGVTIAEVFSKKASFSGKMVKIKGEVTKFTPAVMNKNWIHIQDGSDYKGKFDLVVTTTQEVKVGDKVTFEGKIGLDKDLGYGYFFDVLLEDAVIKQ